MRGFDAFATSLAVPQAAPVGGRALHLGAQRRPQTVSLWVDAQRFSSLAPQSLHDPKAWPIGERRGQAAPACLCLRFCAASLLNLWPLFAQ